MKKRMVTLALALCVALSLAVPAGAATVNDAVEKDMAAMEQALFNVDAITVHSVDNGVRTYAYQLTEDVVDYVTVQHNENGSVTLDIWEEDRHDVMVVLPDGTLLANGEPLGPPAPEPELATREFPLVSPGVVPTANRWVWNFSKNPFPGTVGYYSSNASMTSNPDIRLTRKIREETGGVIGSAIAMYLLPGNVPAQKAISKICANVGALLRSSAEAKASDTNKLSYKAYGYSCSKSTSFDLYRKYKNVYYVGANYKDSNPVTDIYYEYRVYVGP